MANHQREEVIKYLNSAKRLEPIKNEIHRVFDVFLKENAGFNYFKQFANLKNQELKLINQF